MKGLSKYLTPFAPDQSGAVSVLYELGGIIVIIDAGGCVGNVCGFDEPRWQVKKSAIFSAGLRDMDAIMGRDRLLLDKLEKAVKSVNANFVALIGTTVPAVIATDYQGLCKMAERRIKVPVFAVDTNGMCLYDKGASKAYLEAFRCFCNEKKEVKAGSIGILGCNPIDMSDLASANRLRAIYIAEGYKKVNVYGMNCGIENIKDASSNEKNIVVSFSGLEVARFLNEKFGTPYEVINPLALSFIKSAISFERNIPNDLDKPISRARKILIVDEQVAANYMRNELRKICKDVTVASWFSLDKTIKEDGDIHLTEEDQLEELVNSLQYNLVIGDPVLRKIVKNNDIFFLDKKQFAVSGKLI